LPPIDIQRQIVAEIGGYQKVIDGARTVINNYRPHISTDPAWELVPLANLATFSSGGTPSKANESFWSGDIPWVSAKDMKTERVLDAELHVTLEAIGESSTKIAPVGSILILVRGMGLANGVPVCEVVRECAFNQDIRAIHPDKDRIKPRYLAQILRQQRTEFRRVMETAAHGTLKINTDDLRSIQIPLPDLETQQTLIDQIEREVDLVNASHELVSVLEMKIALTLDRVWGKTSRKTVEV
jgi:restriction endonuclease S subunit